MNATHTYAYACADSLGAEFGVIGESGQGWLGVSADGITPSLPDAWQWHFQDTPRQLAPEPDYLVAMEGGNDYLRGADPAAITSRITFWLTQIRAALPDTRIFLLVEFNGFFRDAATQAFSAYQQAYPGDQRVYLIDLGAAGQEGLLTYFDDHGALYTYDGIHPIAARAAVLGQMVAQTMQAAMSR
jgi:lysophospholipase L1-like esterase